MNGRVRVRDKDILYIYIFLMGHFLGFLNPYLNSNSYSDKNFDINPDSNPNPNPRGHALHSLLSRTTFQHLSGTRGPIDFVEVPSHLFEYYARSPKVLSQWARHHVTGKPAPSGLLEEALKTKGSFKAIDLQTQLLYSAADQFIFGPEIGNISHLSPEDIYYVAVEGITKIQMKLTDLPLGENSQIGENPHRGKFYPSMSVLSHSHFVNYGGGYYSYLFAQMFAAQIWVNVLADDPLSRKGGEIIWQKMLRFGAARDTNEMLTELAGGPLKPNNFLK